MWNIDRYKVELTLTEPLLGGIALSGEVWTKYMKKRASERMLKDGISQDEINTRLGQEQEDVQEELRAGLTGFLQDHDGYYLLDYQIKAFFKGTGSTIKELGALKQIKSKVNNYLFVTPRKIYIHPPGELVICERPLRAQTPMGERQCLAASQTVPAGTKITFGLDSLQGVLSANAIKTLLEYGKYAGLGTWRNAGNGRFEVTKFETA